jgi:hypothetical protein
MIVPQSPTAYPVVSLRKYTKFNEFPCGRGFCQNHPACPIPGNKNSTAGIKTDLK